MSETMERDLFIGGHWRAGASGERLDVIDPATEAVVGRLAVATIADLDEALASTATGFRTWRAMSAHDRSALMRRAAEIFRSEAERLAPEMTREQGKPLAEALAELRSSADMIDWYAEEGRRAYGRLIPSRTSGVQQSVRIEPIGPVAAFTPWNFPVSQAVKKIAAALAAGCSIVLKGPEEAPTAVIALVRAFQDAGVPGDVINCPPSAPVRRIGGVHERRISGSS